MYCEQKLKTLAHHTYIEGMQQPTAKRMESDNMIDRMQNNSIRTTHFT